MSLSQVLLLAVSAAVLSVLSFADEPSKPWPMDVLHLRNGASFRGLILDEANGRIRFQNIRQVPGRPTTLFITTFTHDEIQRVERLEAKTREQLREKLKELDPSGRLERAKMERLLLEACEWNGKAGGGLKYTSDFFVLFSDANEEIVRRAAVRLESIYMAYQRFLQPRHRGAKPVIVYLASSSEQYQTILGAGLRNPAYFDPKTNRIYCASDLQKFGEDLRRVQQEHHKHRTEIDRQETVYRKLYKGADLVRKLDELQKMRKMLSDGDRKNEQIFDQLTQRLFATLYHEAFHAYVGNYVYPSGVSGLPGELPRWLNEGLAQIFESALVEAGELRIGHAERDRLNRVRAALKAGELPVTLDVLRAGPREFLVAHEQSKNASERMYLASWALVFYLTFERRLLGTPQLDRFVQAVNANENIQSAFETLTGQALVTFEKDYRRYLARLQPDGTVSDLIKVDP